MSDIKAGKENEHTVRSESRMRTEVSGVTEVESFDETCVILSTVCGEMTIEGETLHVSTLDMERGIVAIDGRVGGVFYSDERPLAKRGLRGRFFR